MTTLTTPTAATGTGTGTDWPRIGRVRTVPNAITLARTLAAVALGLLALAADEPTLLVVGYAVYWVGDVADGWFARRLGQETRLGAVLDIVCDRACTAVLCAGLVVQLPGVLPLALVYLLSFLVVDTMLSLAFLCWPLLSPNDFHLVDRRVWLLNWSPAAKAANTAGVVGAILLGAYGAGLVFASTVVLVKLLSAVRVLALLDQQDR